METKENRSFSDLKFRFAKALFDNHSETEDELEFKRGDVLTILSLNHKALIGWWLCVNHSDGRTGLAPANRLRAIPVPTCDGISGHRLASNSCFALSDMTTDQSMNDDSTRRKSWNAFPREQQFNYDIPIDRQNFGSNIDLYDIPSRNINNTYDIPISHTRPPLLSASSESSDEIRCDSSCHLSDDSVRKRLSDEEMAEYSSDSIELEAIRSIYSVPKKKLEDLYDIPPNNRSIIEQQNQDYDFPKSSNTSMVWNNQCLESLSETEQKCLQTLEQIFKNFCFGTNWRSRDAIYSDHRVSQLQALCKDLSLFLRQFVTLCNRSVLFARSHTSDIKMINKLDQLVQQLTVSLNIVENCLKAMDAKKCWTLEKIIRTDINVVSDDLDRLTACAKHISDDIRHIIATIRGNARLLFQLNDSPMASPPTPISVIVSKPPIAPKPMLAPKHSRQPSNTQLRPLPALPVIETEVENEYNDYEDLSHDYVCLESKNGKNLQNKEWNIEYENIDNENKEIDKEVDKTEVKAFYFQQMRNCSQFLQQNISELIDLIRKNQFQLTKVSLLKDSKCVIICGQKLVFVGQTLVRNSSPEGSKTLNESINHLSDSLKTFVANVRKACLTGRSFPTNQSVETVNESLIEISVLANQLTRSSL